MKNRSLNKIQLLILLMALIGISISWANAETAQNASYAQWKSEQQAQDSRLQKAPASGAVQQNYYLSRPALVAPSSSPKIKLNSANSEQFQQLSGIGLKKAEAIVAYRAKNGKFKSIEEIQQVKGIGPAIFAKNKARLGL
ncbi:ComEA family DNA-binding protein [Acinetobacter sp. WCHAc010034]|uniref:ComEA family DNA-binding protein n=1 Tax=Acinetobacter sp. WCHAc010034 TaxID=1879049 RepID=UPI00083B05EE|nr:ComEA family DNA-binding protein [Acinetobacter sp. WCHAc010034]AYA02833.1 ComEA family DNA-binding protein [Acinetobacter sp. WCHAc010034]